MPSSDVESGLEVSRNSRVNVGADGDGYAEWVPKPVKQSEPPLPLRTRTHARARAHPSSFQHNSWDSCINRFPPRTLVGV